MGMKSQNQLSKRVVKIILQYLKMKTLCRLFLPKNATGQMIQMTKWKCLRLRNNKLWVYRVLTSKWPIEVMAEMRLLTCCQPGNKWYHLPGCFVCPTWQWQAGAAAKSKLLLKKTNSYYHSTKHYRKIPKIIILVL